VVRWWWLGGWAEACNTLLLWRRHNRKLANFFCENKFTKSFYWLSSLQLNKKLLSENEKLIEKGYFPLVFTMIQEFFAIK
jgi:hypothetical protein